MSWTIMNYLEQLKDKRWLKKREEIFERDLNTCRKCKGKRPEFLNFNSIFAFKTYEDMVKEVSTPSRIGNQLLIKVDGWLKKIVKIGFDSIDNPEKLIYAQRWNIHKNSHEFVCFDHFPDPTKIGYDLQVHHKYYKMGKMAWEYENEILETMCAPCHKKVHEEMEIPVFDKFEFQIGRAITCSKCNGVGHLPEYNHVCSGICFRCGGNGKEFKI
jgi:5-methylcytosine-specific restriction endonuclease McrA